MAEEPKMKFTFLDDNGKPMETSSTEAEETQEVDAQEEEQETEQEVDETEDSTEQGEDNGEEPSGEEEDDSEETDGEAEPEAELDSEEEDSEEEDTQEKRDDLVDYDELPDSVQKYLDFFEDTGGSLQDYLEINQDFSKLPQDEVIRKHLKNLYPSLDAEDISYEMERLFGVNEDEDSDADIRRKTVEKKKFYGDALKSLQSSSEKYKTEFVSNKSLPAEAKEAIEFKRNFEAQQGESSKKLEQVRNSFIRDTNKLFGKNFKGFEVKVGEDTVLYKPENVNKIKEQNLDVNNLLGRFLNKDGSVKDVQGYHKALAVASDPESYAQHFYELGKAAMVEEDAADSRNTKLSSKTRGVQPQRKDPAAPKFRFLDADKKSSSGQIKLKHY